MATDVRYYPTDGAYLVAPGSIYAQWEASYLPNPCRKYHISADIPSAKMVADAVLPFAVEQEVFHKVVMTESLLRRQMEGDQAGKFITLYMHSQVEPRNPTIQEIARILGELKAEHGIRPSPNVPKSRRYEHLFMELGLDQNMFIYGGFVCDPGE